MELQWTEGGVTGYVASSATQLLGRMLGALRVGARLAQCRCPAPDCSACEASVMWHQLAVRIVKMMAPDKPAHPPDVSLRR